MVQNLNFLLLPAATKLVQGNIFTSVCQEFCPQEGIPGLVPGGCTWSGPRGVYLADPTGPGTPPGPGTPLPDQVHPLPDQVHPTGPGTSPQTRYPPPDQVHPPRIRTTSGRYASYWNAFLLFVFFCNGVIGGCPRKYHRATKPTGKLNQTQKP